MKYKKLPIDESFYQEEVRCGYTVSAEMKKIWAVELDLLYQLQQVCDKLGIHYYASGGTLLGAIRHKGMIPWDDDIDVMMMRDDYETLCAHADEFEDPYFLQFGKNSEGYFHGHAQLRNGNTTAVVKTEAHLHYSFNQGIFIDIFPLDHVIGDKKLRRRQAVLIDKYRDIAKKLYRTTKNYRPEEASRLRKAAHMVTPLINRVVSYDQMYAKMEAEAQRYNSVPTDYVGKLTYSPFNVKLYDLVSEFDETLYVDFEMMKIAVPVGYEKHLRRQFGNYMEFVIGTSDHGSVYFDPDTPYDVWLDRFEQEHTATGIRTKAAGEQ